MNQRLSRNQFDILVKMAEKPEILSQRQLGELTGCSLGTVNSVMKEFVKEGFTENGRITSGGLAALEPYRVKRAIFIAAGFGTRLVPVTLNTPKPLVRVHGQRLIDGLLDACLKIGIQEIYVVRGYLAEQFDQLLYNYPMVKFLENPSYNEANIISSAMCARHLMQNAYVFEADLLIRNPRILKKYHYTSDFLGIPTERSDDWCFTVKDGIIASQKIGGINCFQEIGISYWDEVSGKKLEKHIPLSYDMPGGKEKYWDQVPFLDYPDEYHVEILECSAEDIVEIDTFKELKAIDNAYDV